MMSKEEENFGEPEPRKLLIVGIKPNIPDLNAEPCSDLEEKQELTKSFQNRGGVKTHDKSDVDPKLHYELEAEIFARLSCLEYWKLQFFNKQFLQLLNSGEIFRMRKKRGLTKPYAIMHAGGETSWKMFDKDFEKGQRLPTIASSDPTFTYGDKETITVGTQLIVIGTESDGVVVTYRYELENQKCFKGPSMISPRVLYCSASWRSNAFFAVGIQKDDNGVPVVVSTVEKYNADTKTWTMINGMHKRRKYSSACFLRGRFFVIGGRDENGENFTCGEVYDEANNSWELIPDVLKDVAFMAAQSPPLIAVVDDYLYSLVKSSNKLRVYDTNANAWKKLGVVPLSLSANARLGWGVAFKSFGDRLLLVGPSSSGTLIYTCRPCLSLDVNQQVWEELKNSCNRVQLPQFIHNCCVMFA